MSKAWLKSFFDTDVRTIREVFDGSHGFYQIPDFQRPYSWTDDEIEELWDDVYSAFESNEEIYFLGPLILGRTKEGEWGEFEVIDGQQRLTTLMIFLCVLRDLYAKKLPDQKLPRRIANAIKESSVQNEYRLRLITQANHQDKFENEVLEKVRFPTSRLSRDQKEMQENRFLNAASLFKEKLEGIRALNRISKLVEYYFEKVVMVTVSCSDRVSAIRLFQVMNTKGLDLSNSDLIKSYLYGQLALAHKDVKIKQFSSTWNSIETLAPQFEESVDGLLTCYGYYFLSRKPERGLYEELTKAFEKKKKASEAIAYDFKRFVQIYGDVYRERSKAIYALYYLPDQVFWKTILTTAKKEKFERFEELCGDLRRLYYSYWIAGNTMAKTRNLSFDIIRRIKKGGSLEEIRSMINEKISEDEILENIKENLDKDIYGKAWARPLLMMIEYEQWEDPEYRELDRRIQIDHVMPQSWKSLRYWTSGWNDEKANYWLNKFGNLALLSGKKNAEARNDAFPKKKKIYKGKGKDGITHFLTSQGIARRPQWNEKEVKKRQGWLKREAKRILE